MSAKKRVFKDRYDIVSELKRRKISMAELGRQNGLSSGTVKNALDKHYENGMQLIADALNMTPEEIWPERFK